jgi:hypothetical protein
MGRETLLAGFLVCVTAAEFLPGANVVRVGDGSGPPGQAAAPVTVSASNDQAIQAFSTSIWFSADSLGVADVTLGALVEALEPEYFDYSVDSTLGNVALGVIFETSPPYDLVSLEPSPTLFRDLASVVFTVAMDAPAGILPLELRDSPGEFPIRNVFTVSGESVLPQLVGGTFEVLPPQPIMFRRGFVNGDLRIDISDAIFLLSWLFAGSTAPTCMAAANANGQGKVDLSDAIWLLSWIFTGGPRPPDPFSSCGEAPAGASPLSCFSQPVCP